MNLKPSSMLMSVWVMSFSSSMIINPEVGLGVVGTNTECRVFSVIFFVIGNVSFVRKPMLQMPFLGYSTITTWRKDLLFVSSRISNTCLTVP